MVGTWANGNEPREGEMQKSTWGKVRVGDWFHFPNKSSPLFRVIRVERDEKGPELQVVLRRQDGSKSDVTFMVGPDEPINPVTICGANGRDHTPHKAQFVRFDGAVLHSIISD